MAKTHDFQTSLERSKSSPAQQRANAAINQFFYGHVSKIEDVEDLETQKKGIDKYVYLLNGKTVSVEEKLRETDYQDVLLEVWSTFHGNGDKRNRVGFIQKENQEGEFFLYCFPSGAWIMIPFQLLLATWTRHKVAWRDDERIARRMAYDKSGSKSLNIAIPFPVLQEALKETAKSSDYSGAYYTEGTVDIASK